MVREIAQQDKVKTVETVETVEAVNTVNTVNTVRIMPGSAKTGSGHWHRRAVPGQPLPATACDCG